MENILKAEHCNFQVLGDPDQTLQIVLLPHQYILTHLPNVIYMSKNLTVRKLISKFVKRLSNLFSNKSQFTHRVKNTAGGVEYVGLTKVVGGKIFAINPKILDEKISIRFDIALAHTNGICMNDPKDINIVLKKDNWKEVSGDGIIFLQTPSTLIEKRLSFDEEILVEKKLLAAFTKDVRITHITENNSFTNVLFYDWSQLSVKGPGVIYLEGTGWSKLKSTHKGILFYSLLFFLLLIFISAVDEILKKHW